MIDPAGCNLYAVRISIDELIDRTAEWPHHGYPNRGKRPVETMVIGREPKEQKSEQIAYLSPPKAR